MREHMEETGIKDGLIAYYYHPKNIHKFLIRGECIEGFQTRWN